MKPPRGLKWLVALLATIFLVIVLDKWSHNWHLVTRDTQGREYYVALRGLQREGMKVRFTLLRRDPAASWWNRSTTRRFELDYGKHLLTPLKGDRTLEPIAPGSVAEQLFKELDTLR